MNSFARKFLITDAERETERSSKLTDQDVMWGSQAGFGHLVEGHAFDIPAVPDVRSSKSFFFVLQTSSLALSVSETSYR